MNVIKIAALKTNYIWMLYNNNNECIVVDPSEAIIILKTIKKLRLILKAIFLTHHHNDHVNGVFLLLRYFPKITVYGPIETQHQGTNLIVSEGDNFWLLNKKITVFDFPGHTLNHIGFYCNPWLFCGDTIFSAGCGTIEPQLIQHMYKSISKIKNFPDNTLICSGHEYTLSNINFAISIVPEDQTIINYHRKIIKLYKQHALIIPTTTLYLELKINIFLRCDQTYIKRSLKLFPKIGEEWKILQKLRNKKDAFKNSKIYYI